MKKLWIAWEDDTSIRSRVLAAELGAEYRAFTTLSNSRAFAWLRYVVAIAQTAWTLLRRRPVVVVAQNPSIVLAWEAALLKPLLGYRLVIDLHTHFVDPKGVKRLVYSFFNGYSLRHCNAVVVTNEAYREEIARQTPHPVFVLPDKVPELGRARAPAPLRSPYNVLYVCTFSIDEPWAEVVASAPLLPEGTSIYISGRSPLRQDEVPENVILTGYLPRAEYEGLLQSVDAVMVLTTAEDNLVCGGYEAVAAGKPLILSDTAALRELFRRGTVFTGNVRAEIARAIAAAQADMPALTGDVRALKEEMTSAWDRRWQRLLTELGLEAGSAR